MSAARTKDGRTARGWRTRRAIGAAYLELVEEGRVLPHVDEIARRAGVSRRTLYLHFADLDAVLTAAVGQRVDECATFVPEPATDLVLGDRLAITVERLDACYARLAPIERSVVAAGLDVPSADAARHLVRLDDAVVEHVRRTYRGEIAAAPDPGDALVRLETALSFSLWRHLRGTRRLDRGATRHYMAQMARAALGMLGDTTA